MTKATAITQIRLAKTDTETKQYNSDSYLYLSKYRQI